MVLNENGKIAKLLGDKMTICHTCEMTHGENAKIVSRQNDMLENVENDKMTKHQ